MTSLSRGTKVEITKQLSSSSAEIFACWIGCYGVIWNCKVAEQQSICAEYRQAKSRDPNTPYPILSQGVAHFLSEERPYLKEVPSQIRRNAGTKFVEAVKAFVKGLRKPPRLKNKYDPKKCLVTNELFELECNDEQWLFHFKKTEKSAPFCTLTLEKPREASKLPKMVWLSRRGARFWISFSYEEDASNIREVADIIESLKEKSEEEQQQAVLAIDLGVKKPLTTSNGEVHGFTVTEAKALTSRENRQLQYQRRMARKREMARKTQRPTGKNYEKVKSTLADVQAHKANIRKNMAHRVSKVVSENVGEVLVVEQLHITNMVKRPKAKQDPVTGEWEKNGASAKAELNKSILNVGWGRIVNYLEYKLRANDKCLVKIPPNYSSQQCFLCDYISSENRQTQEIFCCQRCGHTANADENAAKVLKKRFLSALNTDTFVLPTKTVKRIALRRQKADRASVSVCGAEVRPVLATGTG